MKLFIVISCLIAIARAGAVPTVLAPEQSSQYFSQDNLGQYSYGYADARSAKSEVRSVDGQTVGSYSYVDPEGKLQNVEYKSDSVHGFRASGTNIPVAPAFVAPAPLIAPEPVQVTSEVAAATARHLEALRLAEEAAKKSIAEVQVAPLVRIAAPTYGYSFGINHFGRLNSLSFIYQPFLLPANFIAASNDEGVTGTAETVNNDNESTEVVAARVAADNKAKQVDEKKV